VCVCGVCVCVCLCVGGDRRLEKAYYFVKFCSDRAPWRAVTAERESVNAVRLLGNIVLQGRRVVTALTGALASKVGKVVEPLEARVDLWDVIVLEPAD
jgi:hypothetical protein